MREVTVAADVDADPEAILEALSPRWIIESERTYEVESVASTDEGWRVTAVAADPDIEMELDFRRRPDGYVYDLVRGGPFEVLHTTLTVHDGPDDTDGDAAAGPDGSTRVTMTSEYTLGGWLAPVVDWLAERNRERELEQALLTLASEVGALDSGTDAADEGTAPRDDR